MEVFYKTILKGESALKNELHNEKLDDVREYVLIEPIQPCCKAMQEALDGKAVVFGEVDAPNRNSDVNITRCHPYPEGASWDMYAIAFCPFCGEKIEVSETLRVSLKKKEKMLPPRRQVVYEEVEIDEEAKP